MDQLTFSLDVATEGAESLRRTVMKKISELTGSSTDEALAEYVVVLVGHGKQRAQAVKDLEAFLGSQSEAFVTWLWDHLGSNIHLYTTLNKSNEKNEPVVLERTTESIHNSTSDTEPEEKSHVQLSSITIESGRPVGLKRDPANNARAGEEMGKVPLSSGREKTCPTSEELDEGNAKPNHGLGTARPLKRRLSPDLGVRSDRTMNGNLSIKKRHFSPPQVNVTRRLLQSAVREAVAHATGYSKPPVSSLKRLRSVVSTDTENSEDVAVQRPIKEMSQSSAIRAIKRATPAMMMAMKAAAAAAEDATSAVKPRKRPMPAMMMAMKAAAAAAEDSNRVRGRLVGSSSDRLGKIKEEVACEQVMFRQGGAVESRFTGPSEHGYEQRGGKKPKLASYSRWSDGSTDQDVDAVNYTGESPGRAVHEVKDWKHHMAKRDTETTVSSDTHDDGKQERADDRMERSREESVTVEYRLAQKLEGVSKDSHKQKGSSDASETNPSQKIVNISVNVNTWKPGLYEKMKDTAPCEQSVVPATTQQSQEQPDKAAVTDLHSVVTTPNELGIVIKDEQHAPAIVKQSRESQLEQQSEVVVKEVQRVTLSAMSGTKLSRNFQDDTETRTVFVSNIHFAVTKEALTTHFSPCGDVARIIMLSDGATGQPKGSAYIEFKTVDAAERALTLNESSFYSRVLKVVRKDAAIQAIQEFNPLIHPALIRRPIPVAVRLPLRGRLLRGSPYFLCRYPPTMPRPYGNFPSLQWKRDAAGGTLNASLSSANRPNFGVPGRPARSLSYVRASNSSVVPHQGATVEPNSFPQQQSGDNGVKSDLGDFSHEHKVTDKD